MMVTKDMKMIVSTLKASVVALVMLSTAQNVNAKPVEMVQGKASQTAARAAPHEPVVVENKAHLEAVSYTHLTLPTKRIV